MEIRFGAEVPYRAYVTRLRWLIAGLVGLVSVLVLGMVLMLTNDSDSIAQASSPSVQVAMASQMPALSPTVSILLAKQRIEAGTSLHDRMFTVKTVPRETVPEDVVLARDKSEIRGKYASIMLASRSYLLESDLTDERPTNPFEIPAGYRATTILIDARSGVEGYAKPDSRVDVLWLYKDRDGIQKVATIVRFARIVSIGGRTDSSKEITHVESNGIPSTTATLLVTQREAKIIELAQRTGSLSLSLIGEDEPSKFSGEADENISYSDLIRAADGASEIAGADIDGVFSTTNPLTGELMWFTLREGGWERDHSNAKLVGDSLAEKPLVNELPKEQNAVRGKRSWLEKVVPGFVAHRG